MDGKSSEKDREGKYYLIQNGIYNIIWGMLLLAFNNIFKQLGKIETFSGLWL